MRTVIFSFVFVLAGALFFWRAPFAFAADRENFFVDPSFDIYGRSSVSATKMFEGNYAYYYVEDGFLDQLNAIGRAQLEDALKSVAHNFDVFTYPNETYYFGSECLPAEALAKAGKPCEKITILLTRMRVSSGGYFRPENEKPKTIEPTSNEREMLYLNIRYLTHYHVNEFLAHEFQHLISYNQKQRLRGVTEEQWLNELLSEAAPSVMHLYDQDSFSFGESHLRDMSQLLMANKNVRLTDWQNRETDYAMLTIFGTYLYEQYGPKLFTAIEQTNKTGIAAVNEALASMGTKNLNQVFEDWLVTLTVNNCSVSPENLYCYKNKNLTFDNLHINFAQDEKSEGNSSFSGSVVPWQGHWLTFEKPVWDFRPQEHYLIFNFSSAKPQDLLGKYIVYTTDGSINVYDAALDKNNSRWIIPNFGYTVKRVDLVFANTSQEPVSYVLNTVLHHVPYLLEGRTHADVMSPVRDGDLIRAYDDQKVYVIKGGFKRWIQTPTIFSAYQHFHWEDIKEISQPVLDSFIDSSLVRLESDNKVYKIDSAGKKHWLTCNEDIEGTSCEARWLKQGGNPVGIFTINSNELNLYSEGDSIEIP